jgi:hypothetical protein
MAIVSSASAISSALHTSMRFRPVRRASRTASPAARTRSAAVARTSRVSRVTSPQLADTCTRRWLASTVGDDTAVTTR